jgi:hypothetical protein
MVRIDATDGISSSEIDEGRRGIQWNRSWCACSGSEIVLCSNRLMQAHLKTLQFARVIVANTARRSSEEDNDIDNMRVSIESRKCVTDPS